MADESDQVIAVYHPPGTFVLPAGFKLASHPGLLRVQVTRDAAGAGKVVTTWEKSKAVAEEAGRLGDIGLKAPVWVQEVVEDHPVETPSLARRIFRTGTVVALVAVLGTLETLRNHHAWLLAAPDFAVIPALDPINVLANTPADAKFSVRNTASTGHCETRILGAVIRTPGAPDTPIELDVDTSQWSKPFPRGESHEETLTLPALPAGRHTLHLDQQGRAGLARPWATLPASVAVRAWQPWELRAAKVVPTGERCNLWFELHVGAAYPRGATLRLVLKPADGLNLIAADFPALPDLQIQPPLQAGTGAASVALQEFKLPALPAFSVHRFWIRIAGPARPDAEWRKLYDQIVPHVILEP